MGIEPSTPMDKSPLLCRPRIVRFGPSPSYGIHGAREAHDWFLQMMREHEEFEVETDRAGEWPVPFWSETVRRVVVE